MIETLRFTSCQAPIAEAFCAEVAAYVGQHLGVAVEFVDGIPWEQRLREFDAGRIHVGWLCGLPYTWRADQTHPPLTLLAAPVPAGSRYEDQPKYFSDVVVRRDRPWTSFAQLEGTTWAYTEETSHSGYNMVRERLAQAGRDGRFFRRVVAAGSHEATVGRLMEGQVDAAAIDSTVLDLLHRRDPSLASRLRIIESWGPSPSPPWVVSATVAPSLRAALRGAFLAIGRDPRGRSILATGLTSRFAAVTDADYDPIRQIARRAQSVELQHGP